jgi:hypothetical protein
MGEEITNDDLQTLRRMLITMARLASWTKRFDDRKLVYSSMDGELRVTGLVFMA